VHIIEITEANIPQHLNDLVALGDEFLEQICAQKPRGHEESARILAEMAASSNTGLLLVEDEEGAPIGTSYYNYGSGYSCGGLYLWLNCIYIRESHQKKGYGSKVIEFIEDEGKSKGFKLFITSRHLDNDASRKLFERSGFEQKDVSCMTKEFD